MLKILLFFPYKNLTLNRQGKHITDYFIDKTEMNLIKPLIKVIAYRHEKLTEQVMDET